jgi:hypothetical protein
VIIDCQNTSVPPVQYGATGKSGVPDPDFFFGSGPLDPYPDLTDSDSDPTHLPAIDKKNDFFKTTLLIKSSYEGN